MTPLGISAWWTDGEVEPRKTETTENQRQTQNVTKLTGTARLERDQYATRGLTVPDLLQTVLALVLGHRTVI